MLEIVNRIHMMKGGMYYMFSENFLTFFSIIVSAMTSIVVAIIGVYQTKKAKESDNYRKLLDENQKLRDEQEAKKQKENEERLLRIESCIERVSEDLEEVKKKVDTKHVESQLRQLHTLNEANFEYNQSISNTVITIGEVLSNLDIVDDITEDRLSKDLRAHRAQEDRIVNKILKCSNN